jgi:Zn-dependent peptidase ImmA (M78 family)/transcriptional regulator with XRE-family HTH domain
LPDFNREMLILARERRAFTQAELAEDTGMSQGEISRFETGMKIPSEQQERTLASHLHVLTDFFYFSDSKRDFGSGCVYHRKRQSAKETKLRELLALMNFRRIQIKQLLAAVTATNEYSFDYLDIEEYDYDASKVAQALRGIWKIPPGPVQSVIQVIENAGGIILKSDFGTDRVDALSQWLPGLPPIFLMNDRIPTDRMRWTLMHEVGHILMHRFPTVRMEREADEFAAEFLMPKTQVMPQLHDITLAKLASLKPHWRVAMSALLRRAADLGTITPRTKQYLWTQIGMRGYRKHEPVEIPSESPTLLRELLKYHFDLGHDAQALAKMMGIRESDFVDEYLKNVDLKIERTGASHLRLVN